MFNSDNNTEEQLKRQKSALRLNVQNIDHENKEGIINNYNVTLQDCTCRDWALRRLPCKHMYRLAHELGVFKLAGKVANDKNVKNDNETREEKQKLYQKALELPEDLQLLLYEISRGELKLEANQEIKENLQVLSNAGFIELRQPTEKELYSNITIKDLRAAFPDLPAKGKKPELIAYIRDTAPDFEQDLIRKFNSTCIIARWAPDCEAHRIGIQRKITPYKAESSLHKVEIIIDVTKAGTKDAVRIEKFF